MLILERQLKTEADIIVSFAHLIHTGPDFTKALSTRITLHT